MLIATFGLVYYRPINLVSIPHRDLCSLQLIASSGILECIDAVSIPHRDLCSLQLLARGWGKVTQEVSIPHRDLCSLQLPGLRTLNIFSFRGSFARIASIILSKPKNLSRLKKHESTKPKPGKSFSICADRVATENRSNRHPITTSGQKLPSAFSTPTPPRKFGASIGKIGGQKLASDRPSSHQAKNTVVSIGISPPILSILPWQQAQRK